MHFNNFPRIDIVNYKRRGLLILSLRAGAFVPLSALLGCGGGGDDDFESSKLSFDWSASDDAIVVEKYTEISFPHHSDTGFLLEQRL